MVPSNGAMLFTEQIIQARDLLASISIFEMPKGLVHSFAVVDGMLHGVQPVLSWAKAITLVEDLHEKGCPKKAVLKEAQNLLIQAQMQAAIGSLDVATMADELPATKKPFSTTGVTTTGKGPKWNTNSPNFQQVPKTSAPAPHEVVTVAPPPHPKPPPTVLFSSVNPKCLVAEQDDQLLINTPFNAAFVSALKTLPPYERKWNASKACWLVDTKHKNWVINLIQIHYSPACTATNTTTQAHAF